MHASCLWVVYLGKVDSLVNGEIDGGHLAVRPEDFLSKDGNKNKDKKLTAPTSTVLLSLSEAHAEGLF